MSKPWDQPPLWWKVYLGKFSSVYVSAGKIIGHLGCGGFAYWDAAKLLPNYHKLHFENALRDLTVYAKRERGEYELTETAKKVLRPVLGPAPDAPDYRSWWAARLVTVEQMKRDGLPVEWAESPPVPLTPPDEEPAKKPPRKTATKPRKASSRKRK